MTIFKNTELVLDYISNMKVSEEKVCDIDKAMSRFLISYANVRYFEEKKEVFPITDIIGIKSYEIYNGNYVVTDVGDSTILQGGDIIISPMLLSADNIIGKELVINTTINILRTNTNDPQLIKKDIHVVLGAFTDDSKKLVDVCKKNKRKIVSISTFNRIDVPSMSSNSEVVLDLRNNHGGKINDMVKFFNSFFNGYAVIGRFTSDSNIDFTVSSKTKSNFQKKITLIVNKVTASAAEIFVMLCKEYFDAQIIGQNTFGKDVICDVIKTDYFTFQYPRYTYTINGKKLPHGGIIPDIVMSDID